MIQLPRYFAEYRDCVDAELRRLVSAAADPVSEAMAYTLLSPSKRIRPVLTLLSAELCGGTAAAALAAGCAVEMVHASSLILDDLPSMDNSAIRRGRPANHAAHGEAIAILAAFNLLDAAFGTLARAYTPAMAAPLTVLVSDAVGTGGLIGGQAEDLLATDRQISFETLERIHRRKTGALFSAAATAGAITACAPPESVAALQAFAKNLGLAFQIVDDLLDVEGDPAVTGKPIREDMKKTTFVSFSGAVGARQLAAELCHTADQALLPFGSRAGRLRELSTFVGSRVN